MPEDFYSLNSQELPEVFEDDIAHWMELFHGMLNVGTENGGGGENGALGKGMDVDGVAMRRFDAVTSIRGEERRGVQTVLGDVRERRLDVVGELF